MEIYHRTVCQCRSLVRLAIYRVSNQRILLQGGLASFDDPVTSRSFDSTLKARRTLAAFENFRSRHVMPNLQANGNAKSGDAEYWWSVHASMYDEHRPNTIQKLEQFEQQMDESNELASKLLVAGEILHILRPMMYVACLRIWGVKSWKPWILSLVVELSSAQATKNASWYSKKALQQVGRDSALARSTISLLYAKQGIMWNTQELDELTKRKLLLVFYLIRDPVFGKVTLPIMQKWVHTVERVPLVSWLSERFTDFIQGIQKYYAYTSAA